ncbi:MAG: ATP-dependent sacrificial sulfur transferase LarE [Thermoplasmata archaeon]|nr:ATP-dependent sacrificial sulfur transferase LarE [Thermoplasmata archaeon]
MLPNLSSRSLREPVPAASIVSQLAGRRSALVALSGGVDSSVVAFLAYEALGSNAVAVTLSGPAVSSQEIDSATNVARAIGLPHVFLTSDPLVDPQYAANPTNRCYFCRRHEGGLFRAWGEEHAIELYLDGVHADDLGDDRPGLQAMNEHGFRHPLAEAGWTKADVRAFARSKELSTWDRPSNACLSSRIAHGQLITAPLLDRVAQAEVWLSGRGFRRARVRVSGDRARVEVDPDQVPRLQLTTNAEPLREVLVGLGFATVEIDPNGYRLRSNA